MVINRFKVRNKLIVSIIKYKIDSALIDEFVILVSKHFNCFNCWTSKDIEPSNYCLYGRIVPAKEVERKFIEQVT